MKTRLGRNVVFRRVRGHRFSLDADSKRPGINVFIYTYVGPPYASIECVCVCVVLNKKNFFFIRWISSADESKTTRKPYNIYNLCN